MPFIAQTHTSYTCAHEAIDKSHYHTIYHLLHAHTRARTDTNVLAITHPPTHTHSLFI